MPLSFDPILCKVDNIGKTENYCNRTGTSFTDHCSRLFVDVGGNTGQSLDMWYQSTDRGHGMREYAKAETWQSRRLFCADVFEGSPSFTKVLTSRAAYHQKRGKHVHLYSATPFTLNGGLVTFEALGFHHNIGGQVVSSTGKGIDHPSETRHRDGAIKPELLQLQSMNAIDYLKGITASRLVLKIDVETFEFELLRGLIASGVLCDPRRKTDVFVEWHVPRGPRPDGTYHHLFNETEYGLPRLTTGLKENFDAFATKDAMLWMAKSYPCRNLTFHQWW